MFGFASCAGLALAVMTSLWLVLVGALAIIAAILAAFVKVPILTDQDVAAILIVLGVIAGLGNTPEDNTKAFLATLVLMVGAATLAEIPSVGTYLSDIFGNLGKAFLGASITGIVLGLARKVKSDWVPAKK